MFKILKVLTPKERQLLISISLVFAVSFIFWATRTYFRNTVIEPATGGVFVEGLIGQPALINPVIAAMDTDRDITELVFASLPTLIEKQEVSEDQKTWSFTLKENLVWSDGEPITSDDFIFTLELIKDADTRSPLSTGWQGVIGERLSERQFRFSLKTPYAFFADNLKSFKPIPRHIFENIPPINLRLSEYNLEPVASGPFVYNSFEKRKDGFIYKHTLVRNENYAGKKPLLDGFQFQFFANKEDLVSAFNQKEVSGFGGLEFKDLENLLTDLRLYKISIPSYYAVFFNQALNAQLKEKNIRQALTLAVDKQKIAAEVFDGHAIVVHGPITPGVTGYEPSIYQNERFDADTASALLENNGWKREEDGIRSKTINRKKVRLEFEIIVPQADFLIKTVEILRNDWEKIGVRLNPVVLRPLEVSNDIIKTRNYQMLIFGTIIKNNPDIFSFWHSSERFYPGGNLAIFNNKTADGLLESIKILPDPDKRAEAAKKIQSIIYQEQPAIFLYSPLYLYVTSKDLGGFESQSINARADRFNNIANWHLKTSRSFNK